MGTADNYVSDKRVKPMRLSFDESIDEKAVATQPEHELSPDGGSPMNYSSGAWKHAPACEAMRCVLSLLSFVASLPSLAASLTARTLRPRSSRQSATWRHQVCPPMTCATAER